MKRDTLKTLAGLAIIAIIVVATFVYGSAQRQAQLKHDQEAKKQQEAAAGDQAKKAEPSASAAASATATPEQTLSPTPGTTTQTATPQPSPSVATNTAPVQSPATNTLQGSGATGQQVAGTQTAAPTTPATGASGGTAPLPEAGSPIMGVVGLTAMMATGLMVRRSRQAIVVAARNRR